MFSRDCEKYGAKPTLTTILCFAEALKEFGNEVQAQ